MTSASFEHMAVLEENMTASEDMTAPSVAAFNPIHEEQVSRYPVNSENFKYLQHYFCSWLSPYLTLEILQAEKPDGKNPFARLLSAEGPPCKPLMNAIYAISNIHLSNLHQMAWVPAFEKEASKHITASQNLISSADRAPVVAAVVILLYYEESFSSCQSDAILTVSQAVRSGSLREADAHMQHGLRLVSGYESKSEVKFWSNVSIIHDWI